MIFPLVSCTDPLRSFDAHLSASCAVLKYGTGFFETDEMFGPVKLVFGLISFQSPSFHVHNVHTAILNRSWLQDLDR